MPKKNSNRNEDLLVKNIQKSKPDFVKPVAGRKPRKRKHLEGSQRLHPGYVKHAFIGKKTMIDAMKKSAEKREIMIREVFEEAMALYLKRFKS